MVDYAHKGQDHRSSTATIATPQAERFELLIDGGLFFFVHRHPRAPTTACA
jgi:hypothetical protein